MERRTQSCNNFRLIANKRTEKPTLANAFARPQTRSTDNLPLALNTCHTKAGVMDGGSLQQQQQVLFALQRPLRRKRLQRQQSAIDQDEYAADVEEDADGEAIANDLVMRLQKQQSAGMYGSGSGSAPMMRHLSSISTSTSISSGDTYSTTSTPTPTTNLPTRLRRFKHEESFDSSSSMNAELSPLAQRHHFNLLMRDSSVQSDSSRYSSVDSLLEARKPDPEAILINLGFGPAGSEDILSRIPKRFLKPSQVRGIDTEAFVKRLQLASSLAESSVMGFRGLHGNPDVPPSSIVAKIMQRFEVNQRKKSMDSVEHTIR